MERYYYDEPYKRGLISLVLKEFFVLLLICTIGMVFGMMFVPPQFAFLAGIGSIIVLIVAAVTRRRENRSLSRVNSYSVAFLLGISTFPTILYYVSAMGSMMVLVSLGITTTIFGGLALYSSQSKRDFSFLGGTLYAGLIALILIGIVGIFLKSEVYNLAIAWLGILIFSGYVLYDLSIIKNNPFTEEDVPGLALNLFLDFINIFIYVLRIVSRFSSRD
ncbi:MULTISPECIES: Bax inhibitor-1/YccA family protein [unclassified Sedimentibacter]|uniref:Bax inhibitor-1/YccA family protein n=1 Tax=unclassified Sedimentibacter TaxID=2649220 RepID=UPI0027E1E0CF|nr:Bax inhibitor-1/YccA family protein [Sedimentibacter sp. MB35-C1]WMJ77688.1 Bax inhibitor-1/YccA family protein [Sedimentibacter sp. MB35-C1]